MRIKKVSNENSDQMRFQALHHQFIASAKAVKLGHEINPDFKIGCMIAYMSTVVSADPSLEEVEGNLLGGIKNPYLKASDWGWQIDPKGLRWTLNFELMAATLIYQIMIN